MAGSDWQAVVLPVHGRLVFSAFDPDGYQTAGHRTGMMSAIVLVLLTAATALMASQVGVILTVAFLLAAPSAARAVVRGPAATIVLSWLLGTAAGTLGATLSAVIAVPPAPPSRSCWACSPQSQGSSAGFGRCERANHGRRP